MRVLIGLAYITVKENVRKRSFYGILLASLLSILFARILMEFSLQDLTKVFIDFSYSLISFFFITSTLFISTDVMAKDIEKKAVYTLLSRGISREAYVFGRAFGLFVFLLIFTLIIGFVFIVATKAINSFTPVAYKKSILTIPAIYTLFVLLLKAFLLSCVVLFFASFMSSFFLVFLSSVAVYIVGSSVESLHYFVHFNQDKVPEYVKLIIDVLFYAFPSFSSLGTDVILGTQEVNAFILGTKVAKTIVYSLFLIFTSAFLMRKREF